MQVLHQNLDWGARMRGQGSPVEVIVFTQFKSDCNLCASTLQLNDCVSLIKTASVCPDDNCIYADSSVGKLMAFKAEAMIVLQEYLLRYPQPKHKCLSHTGGS